MKKRKKTGAAKRVFRALTATCAVLSALLAGYIYILKPDRAPAAPRQTQSVTAADKFAADASVGGIPIGGMTKEEALLALWPLENEVRSNMQFILKTNTTSITLTHNDFDVRFNTPEILNAALTTSAAAETGTLSHTVDFTPARQKLESISDAIYKAPQDASVEMDMKTEGFFRYVEGQPGEALDMEALIRDLQRRIDAQEYGEVPLPIIYTEPDVSIDMLKASLTRRSFAETSFARSPYNREDRVYNVKRAASLVNGFVLKSGETFSTNATLGDRTYELGWKPAPAIVSGTTEDQAGGGVCQLSSTLYAAVVKADLEIVHRRNHSSPVGYIPRGLDATINTGTIDFQFKNNTASDIYIFAYTVDKKDGEIPEGKDDKTIHVEIYGAPLPSEYDEIRLTSEQLETLRPTGEMQVIVDTTVAPDYYKEEVERKNGSVWQSYKHYYKDGVEIKKENLAKSTYRAYEGKITVGSGYYNTQAAAGIPVA